MQDTKLLPNSFLFISVPTASRAQWHPFTLAYVRNSLHVGQPAVASLHIKPYGRWSQVSLPVPSELLRTRSHCSLTAIVGGAAMPMMWQSVRLVPGLLHAVCTAGLLIAGCLCRPGCSVCIIARLATKQHPVACGQCSGPLPAMPCLPAAASLRQSSRRAAHHRAEAAWGCAGGCTGDLDAWACAGQGGWALRGQQPPPGQHLPGCSHLCGGHWGAACSL